MISAKHLHRNLNMELVTRCRCHHHVTSVWPCAATWWWVGIRHFCYNAQAAHYSRCCALSSSSVQLQCRRMMCAALCGRGASTELFVWCLGRIRMKDWEWGSGPAHTSPAPASTVGPDSAQQHSGGQTWSGYSCSGHNIDIMIVTHECWETECELLWLFPLCLWLIVHCSIVTFWSSEALIALLVPPYPVLTLTRAAVARLSPYIRLDVMWSWSQHNSCSYPGPWLLQCAAHTSASSNQSTAHSSPPQ